MRSVTYSASYISNALCYNYILVSFLTLSPDVKHQGQQDNHSERQKLRQFVGWAVYTAFGNIRRGGDKNVVAGNSSIGEWQERHYPGSKHASRDTIRTRHIRITIA